MDALFGLFWGFDYPFLSKNPWGFKKGFMRVAIMNENPRVQHGFGKGSETV